MASSSIGLSQPLVAAGLARTYFFNGRLLSAEDLQREQALREAGQRGLAQLLGCGIERGFAIGWSAGSSELSIGAGLGVAASGDVIETGAFKLDLAQAARIGPAGAFVACSANFGSAGALAGLHLLVLTPAWIADGRAPTLIGSLGACNRNVELPAVRARLVPLNTPPGAGATDLRNRLAVALLTSSAGSAARLSGWWPTSMAPTLAAADLPIAVLQIDVQAHIVWVDPEAARRPLGAPPGGAGDELWPRSRRTEMEAFARQFAAQLLGSGAVQPPRPSGQPESGDYAWLPPAVLLDAALKARWESVFGAVGNLALPQPETVGRERFATALEGGLYGEPVAQKNVALHLMRFGDERGTVRSLLRIRAVDDPDIPKLPR